MEPENQNQTLETNEYMTPARQEDLQQKLEAEEAYVEKWAHTANVDQPKQATQEPTGQFNNDGATATPIGSSFSTPPAEAVPPQSLTSSFESPISETDNYENYSTPHEVGQEYAVLSLVMAIVSPLAGVVLALLAMKKSKQSHQKNRLAKISLLINVLFLVLITGFIIFLLTPTEPTTIEDTTSNDSSLQDATNTTSNDSAGTEANPNTQ